MSNDPTETTAVPQNDGAAVDADASMPVVAEASEAPKPKRRAPRKTKTAVEGSALPPEGASGEAGVVHGDGSPQEPAAAAPVPRKTSRRRKAAVADALDAVPAAGTSGPALEVAAGVVPTAEPVLQSLAPDSAAIPAPASVAVSVAAEGAAGSVETAAAPAASPEGAGEKPAGRRRRDRRERSGGKAVKGEANLPAEVSAEPGGEVREPQPGQAPEARGEAGGRKRKDGAARRTGGAPQPVRAASERFADVLSGQFDEEQAGEGDVEAPAKRVLAPEPEAPKLHKVLAQAGIGSRRDMEQMILEGRISVNGEPAHIGQRISYGDQVRVNGKPIKFRIAPPAPRLLAYHKPVGEVVTHNDPENRPTVFRRLPKLPNGKWQSVGRLDLNTEGLLLFTNSGELANQLMHPRFGVEREYAVRVLGSLDDASRAKLLEGVKIDGQPASFKSIEDGGGDGANRWYRVVITEGRNREVRKLFEAVGLAVSRLIRIRYGSVVLPRGLKRGVWVELDENDVRTIRRLAGGDAAPRPAAGEESGGKPGPGHGGKRGVAKGSRPSGPAQPGPGGNRRGGKDNRAPKIVGPDPLEQTYDKRFAQKTLARQSNPNRQPDPLQTSVGYIGGDAFYRKGQGGGRGGRGGSGGGGGGGGGFGGSGGGFGGNRGNRGGGRGR